MNMSAIIMIYNIAPAACALVSHTKCSNTSKENTMKHSEASYHPKKQKSIINLKKKNLPEIVLVMNQWI